MCFKHLKPKFYKYTSTDRHDKKTNSDWSKKYNLLIFEISSKAQKSTTALNKCTKKVLYYTVLFLQVQPLQYSSNTSRDDLRAILLADLNFARFMNVVMLHNLWYTFEKNHIVMLIELFYSF